MDDDDALEGLIRYGQVVSVDLAAGRCVVASGEIATQPIRWIEVRAGKTRTWSPPSAGEQVLLLCPGGDPAGAIALRGVSSAAHPPIGDATRELIEFPDGAVLAYDATAHALTAILPSTGTVRIEAGGGLHLTGPLFVDGEISATEDVVGKGVSLATHRHGLVKLGTDKSGAPE
ncbi:phage baseplate assembly protein V [Sphingomonas sp. PL-96]|uniref:phage baseplate assembly protein V n=1 Tax=Sphingomonas sp. PL-96 TaxID=2887201 RepID=UPI001E50C68E|nr:phage baseplate assembly protein V [Sphingomonas sp. PL-96]MCC2976239.1 phage baseplate assembly protein V [Sphingomonas sp. PL-96]